MDNIRFHIFGVPDGFDIYQEVIDMENKSYYQCFYDESIKEQTRLAINRKPNGDVSYTYLKYHLYSNGDRPNAFLGLSVVFSNGYYADVSSLYNLLEQTYNSILQKGKLLNPIANGSARFAVNKFSDEPSEIKRIESIVIGTLSTKEYIAEYLPFDNSFETGKQNAILKVPFQIYDNDIQERDANLLVVEKLKKFSWLSLSPDYIRKEEPVLPGEVPSTKHHIELDEELDPVTKAQYINSFENYQSQVLAAFEKLVNKTDESLTTNVRQLDSIVKGILVSLRKYGKKQNELKDLLNKYSDLAEKLETLSDKLYESSQKQPPYDNNDKNPKGGKEGEHKNIRKRKGGKWQRYSAVAGGAIAVVCVLIFFCKPDWFRNNNPGDNTGGGVTDTTTSGYNLPQETKVNLEDLLAKFNEALQNDNFETAIDYYLQVADADENQLREFDNILDEKFNTLISNCAFDLANNLCHQLTKIYKTTDTEINELKSSFKNYVKANKSKVEYKDTLINKIQFAKVNNYAYSGIDSDLAEIRNLGSSSQKRVYQLALYYEGSETATKKPKSSEIIEIYLNRQYKIKNLQHETDASFIHSIDSLFGEDFITDKGHSIQFKIRQAKIGQKFQLHYKRKNQTLFTITIEVVEEKHKGQSLKLD